MDAARMNCAPTVCCVQPTAYTTADVRSRPDASVHHSHTFSNWPGGVPQTRSTISRRVPPVVAFEDLVDAVRVLQGLVADDWAGARLDRRPPRAEAITGRVLLRSGPLPAGFVLVLVLPTGPVIAGRLFVVATEQAVEILGVGVLLATRKGSVRCKQPRTPENPSCWRGCS